MPTRYVRVVPLPHGYKADAMRRAIAADLRQLPPALRKSLTWDRGREMAEHQELRQYLAKGADPVAPGAPLTRVAAGRTLSSAARPVSSSGLAS